MLPPLPNSFVLSPEVANARQRGLPIVALESAVITHGLPRPDNLTLAQEMESIVRENGAVPATIAVLDGKIRLGLETPDLEKLANAGHPRKISSRDFAAALAKEETGGTTVAGTLVVAEKARIRVFATGGIGGVHRQPPFDISADLPQLVRSPLVVVCAGAKAILDLRATLEVLETFGVPVIGYQTDEFPAFYSRESGLPVSVRADAPEEIARIARAHWGFGLTSAVLVAVPPPEDAAIPSDAMERYIKQALAEAETRRLRGQAVTPFLLTRVSELSGGKSLLANLALLKNNARLAAQIARRLVTPKDLIA